MAFRQPQVPQHHRQSTLGSQSQQPEPISVESRQLTRTLEESQEWVLFSPTGASTTQTHTTSTERTPRTAGLSRISDFGSLETAARSQQEDDDDVTCQGTEMDEDENEELDSLDDGLHAFHEPSEGSGLTHRLAQASGSILPAHDGFGGFRASANPVQEQLWQYERYNPRRRQVRRRSSVQKKLEAMDAAEEAQRGNEKHQRIERWRMEQSRALLEEIERETRRKRRMSRTSIARSSAEAMEEDQASMSGPTMEEILTRPDTGQQSTAPQENESFWQRFTRRVIHDLMGIDENLLSVIFGEAIPEENSTETSRDTEPSIQDFESRELAPLPTSSWEHRLLQRIARELGILVHHISEHPGAFSTYLRARDTPTYAGLAPEPTTDNINTTLSPLESNPRSLSSAPFAPTLQPNPANEASMWGMETETTPLPNIAEEPSTSPSLEQEREYWERDLDVKMVFSYIRNRFSSRPASPERDPRRDSGFDGSADVNASANAASSLSTSPESRRRAALIRRHHPLTSRSAAMDRSAAAVSSRRNELLHRHHLHHGGLAGVVSVGLRRQGSSSCASQSTRSKRSMSRRSAGSRGSRNFWDLGGSVGSAPLGSDAGVA
ncbi:MAG: hypothetical protein M1820_010721 [Bogoriella megaspora]|nr:MAG: hypothetical protein M1820_010721 [Bogoriella megaspora]